LAVEFDVITTDLATYSKQLNIHKNADEIQNRAGTVAIMQLV